MAVGLVEQIVVLQLLPVSQQDSALRQRILRLHQIKHGPMDEHNVGIHVVVDGAV